MNACPQCRREFTRLAFEQTDICCRCHEEFHAEGCLLQHMNDPGGTCSRCARCNSERGLQIIDDEILCDDCYVGIITENDP